jgi:hypothetical protein
MPSTGSGRRKSRHYAGTIDVAGRRPKRSTFLHQTWSEMNAMIKGLGLVLLVLVAAAAAWWLDFYFGFTF